MAEVLLQSPDLQSEEDAKNKEILVEKLDELLERYLNLLDNYQSLQQILSKNLSSGFLDLAQANFSNPNRIRYGQDLYDERMQASLTLTINSSNPVISIDTSHVSPSQDSEKSDPTRQEPIVDASSEGHNGSEKNKDSNKAVRDPLKWFGVLIPPSLRSSQTSFKAAVFHAIPALVNVNVEMKEVEIEVRRTRKRLNKLQ